MSLDFNDAVNLQAPVGLFFTIRFGICGCEFSEVYPGVFVCVRVVCMELIIIMVLCARSPDSYVRVSA